MLEIKNLNASFAHSGHFRLKNIALSIALKERVALVGESGSGKSMLAQMILNLQPNIAIQSGEICFNGKNVLSLSPKQMRVLRGNEIAYIPQEPLSSLNPLQKVGKQIMESFYLHAPALQPHLRGRALQIKAQERLEELLCLVGLDSKFAHSYPFELSGGQKQRVAIAMSIINNPTLLICDEPTTALDVLVQKQIMGLLSNLELSAILFISHDLGVVRDFCDKVVVMKDGAVVEQDSTEHIFNAPSHAYTRFLIESLTLPKREGKISQKIQSNDKEAWNGEIHNIGIQDKDTQTLLEVKNLSVGVSMRKFFKTSFKSLVSNVDFTLQKGEILGIAGASGSGKSSLSLGLLGLLQTQGEIYFQGRLHERTKDFYMLRNAISIVFQDPFSSLSPRLSIGDIIAEALGEALSMCRDKVQWALESVGLDSHYMQRYPFELSGGQKQRVAIARAIVRKPAILLLDEPTSALDKSSQKLILSLLLELQAQLNMSYIFITHDLEILRALSDEVLILHNGQVVEQGVGKEVFANPQNAYAKSLIETFFNKILVEK